MTDAPIPEPDPAEKEAIAVTPTPTTHERGWRRWVVALVALVAVAAGVAAVTQAGEAGDLRGERADRREVARVAAAFGEAYLSYDFDDVEASSEAVRALATDAFAAGFEETSAPGIQELFASNQTTTVATVEEVFVGDVGDGRARALVVVDVAAASAATGTQELSDLSFVLDLVDEDGEWLVSAVAPAPRPDISDPTGAPTAPTTTAPAGTTAPTPAP